MIADGAQVRPPRCSCAHRAAVAPLTTPHYSIAFKNPIFLLFLRKSLSSQEKKPVKHDISEVILGAHSIKKAEKDSKQFREVKKRFPHPDFCNILKGNDLMLLKLNNPVMETKTVTFLKLGKTLKDPAAGSNCLVAGWGKTEKKNRSDVLLSVNVTVIDRKKCNSRGYYNHNPVITSDMICAGSNGNAKAGTCNGDSGGPLLCNKELVGVTSFGPAVCGGINEPAVFSFLSKKQLKWIKKTMKSSEF